MTAPPVADHDRSALAEARALGAIPAGVGRRAAAFTIDLLIGAVLLAPAVVGAVLLAVNGFEWSAWSIWLTVIGAALVLVYQLVNVLTHGMRGVTAGRASLGLRSVSANTLEKPGFWRIVLRSIVLSASTAIPILAILLLIPGLGDRQRAGRSLLDRVGGCWSVNVRSGLDPLDRSALLTARRGRDLAGVSTVEQIVPLGTWVGVQAGAGGQYWPAASAAPSAIPRSQAGVVGFAGTLAGWDQHHGEAGA